MKNKLNVFKTKRLILKPTTNEDAEFILELLNTPKWLKYIGDRSVNSIANAREYIETKMLPQLERLGYSNYTVIKKSDNIKIGTCGLYDREGLEGIDLGFAFLPEFESNGYAYESAQKLINVSFDEFHINEIKAITTKENISSQKLLKKLKFKLKEIIELTGDTEEMLLY